MRRFLLLPLLALSSCAFATVNVTPPKAPQSTGLTGGKQRAVQLVVPLADARAQPNRCGMQKNGYNMDTANVVCSVAPASWLAESLATELRTAGFTVLPSAPTGATALRLEGKLLQFFVEPKVGFLTFTPEADIHIRLVASSPSGLLAERDFYVKGEETSLVGAESNFQSASDGATRQILGDMVRAVIELMDRYPELGTLQVTTPAS